ncbi:hypothetical protein ACLBXM_23110 [Xanthobacteraceae bacterium A53D]
MSDDKKSPEQEQAEQELAPALEKLAGRTRELILERAKVEGWSPSQADWLDKLAKQPLLEAVTNGTPLAEALEASYGEARRRLTVGYYNNALDEGKNIYTAFMTVIDLERQLAERRGEEPAAYPDAILMQACEAAEQASEKGLDAEDQIGAGFAVIRALSQRELN